MIGRLTGRVLECRPDHLLVDVNGVGYHVFIPLSTYYVVQGAAGATVTVHVHTRAREDALQLYGFASTAERSLFETLIGIGGVGPRLALSFLSGIGVEELREAVYREDRARLQKIPGVGRKTAERVLLELRDRLGPEDEALHTRASRGSADETGEPDTRDDAVSALVNLGYNRDAAARSVDAALERAGPTPSLEALLRESLGRLSR